MPKNKTISRLADEVAAKVKVKRLGRPKKPETLAAEKDAFIIRMRAAIMEGLDEFGDMLPQAIHNMAVAVQKGDLDTSLWVVEKFYGKPAEKIVNVQEKEDPVVSLLKEMQAANAISAQAANGSTVEGTVREITDPANPSNGGSVLEQQLAEAGDGRRG